MSYNKKALKIDLGKFTKSNPYKDDIISDDNGQWTNPGLDTRVHSPEITMAGVPHPVMAYPNYGIPQIMLPGEDYYFPGADYVDEVPIRKVGGIPELPLTAGRKAYHTWGYTNNDFIANRQTGGPTYISDPNLPLGYNPLDQTINYDPNDAWQNINNPKWKAHEDYHHEQNMKGRSSLSGLMGQRPNKYTASDEAIMGYYNRRENDLQNEINAMINSNPSLQFIPREKLRYSQFDENGQPIFLGAEERMYSNPTTEEGEARLQEDLYQEGGDYIEAELTPEEIEEYRKGGYIIEDISVPSLVHAQQGMSVIDMYNQSLKKKPVVKEKLPIHVESNTGAPNVIDLYNQSLKQKPVVKTPVVEKPYEKAPVYNPKSDSLPGPVQHPYTNLHASQEGLTPYALNLLKNRNLPEQKVYTRKDIQDEQWKPKKERTKRVREQEPEEEDAHTPETGWFDDLYNYGKDLYNTAANYTKDAYNTAANYAEEKYQHGKRFLQKEGLLDIEEQTIDPTKIKVAEPKIKNTPKPAEFYQDIATVKDEGYSDNELMSYRNQWDNNKGFVYLTAPVKKDRTGNEEYNNVKGVGHFLLDASASSDHTFSNGSNLKYLRDAIKNDEYVPVFEDLGGNKVKLKYKKASELSKAEKDKINKLARSYSTTFDKNNKNYNNNKLRDKITDEYTNFQKSSKEKILTPLRQMNFGDIRFDQTQKPEGFKSGIKEVKKSDGKGTYLLFKDRNGYSRFSGGSVVFIFKDKYGNTIVRDYAGSLNGIENEGLQLMKDYNLKGNDLTIGYHDVGSFSAKPKSVNGKLSSKQWEGFNDAGVTGGALIIPNQ